MPIPNISVKIQDFRAIHEAEIVINGITLVAGENGCGKSSISKLLYFLYKNVSNYDSLVRNKLIENLRDVLKFIDIAQQEIGTISKNRAFRYEFRREFNELRRNIKSSDFLEEQLINWFNAIEKLEELYTSTLNENTSSKTTLNPDRLNYIIKDILKKETDFLSVNPFEGIKFFIESKFKEAVGKIQSRPTSLFIDELKSVFDNGDLPSKFEVLEFNNLIVSLDKNHLSIPYSIQNAIYIDTPMMISVEDSHNIHWDDLNGLLLNRGNIKNKYSQIISREIIQGDVEFNETIYSADDLKFKRSDGAVFNLLDVATGIKAFSILQMLLKNGLLNDKTLLVIDEPESNLHPQWIIEYARIVVLLNKELGVKFFLASHNPDFVSAIRYIAEKEDILDRVNFYLAKVTTNKFKYDYTHLGKEIDPIFESFNMAIDKINRYGI